MVVPGPEMNSQGEGVSNSNQQEVNKNHSFSSLGRQSSSIYSLTLDEFQHTLCETGKNFGSMNMDEFLSSIWSAEENQANNNNNNSNQNNSNNNINITNNNNNLCLSETVPEKGFIREQPSLPRQGSLTIPAPLCRKTVDEVWSEIHKGQQSQLQDNNSNGVGGQNTETVPRQPTFGEMTLEDFLVKAGVVREHGANFNAMTVQVPSSAQHQLQQQQQQFGMYPNVGPSFRPVMGIGAGGAGGNAVVPPYPAVAHSGGGAIVEAKRDGGYPVVPGVGYGGRMVNGGGGGYGGNIGVGGPVSPVSPDGMGGGENCGGQFGIEMGMLRGRKRGLDGPVEKVVERRQRRMIKNRESAARSRARKQAYTVELEAELNQLKEENTQLKLALAEFERRRKQQYLEESNGNGRVQTNAQKAKKKLRSLRRNLSSPL